ncbi:hypothetical protein V1511DRAFT_509480 [Dipodascopsis uninucleata]
MGMFDSILSKLGILSTGSLYNLLRGYSNVSTIDPELDIALVTGGSAGLGHNIVKELRAKKIPVVVLDVQDPDEKVEGVYYMKCDISSREQVNDAAYVIKQEIGDITILINNAAITHGKTIIDLSLDDIDKTVGVNLLSHFYTIKAFLPGMLKLHRGCIVTVASVMGYIGPVKLSAYAASKGGLVSLYESLTYELGPNAATGSGIRTILVATGQLHTRLFEGVNTPSHIVAPVQNTKDVATRIMLALVRGEQGRITMPTYARFMPLMRILPRPAMTVARYLTGIDRGMDTFLGSTNGLNTRGGGRTSFL